MRSAFTSLSVLATGLMILAVTGCSSGGGSDEAPPEVPPPPGVVDDTPGIPEPAVKYQYFVVDLYDRQDPAQAPVTRPYQYKLSQANNTVLEISQKAPLTLLRPPVALAAGRLSHAFAVMQEIDRFWYLAPDMEPLRPLSKFDQPSCALSTGMNPAADAWFRARRTFLTGVGYENAGVYVRTPGENGVCDLEDDQFWAISMAAKDNQDAIPVSKAVVLGQPLLDHEFKLQGYIYAAPGEAVQTLDAQGTVVQEQVSQASGSSLADGYVLLHQPYGDNGAVLVIGSRLYLVDPREVAQPDFVLPPPVLTLSEAGSAPDIRFDEDRFYLIDGTRLQAVDYTTQTVSDLFDGASLDLTTLSFGNPDKRHGAVFTANYIVVLGESASGKQLVAIRKNDGQVATIIDGVTDEFLATDQWVYVSRTEQDAAGETALALVYQDNNGLSELTDYRHVNAHWHFFRDGKEYRAFLITGSSYAGGFFYKPQFAIYEPGQPEEPEHSLPAFNENWSFRIAEMGDREGGHLMLTMDTDNGANRGRTLYHLDPKKQFKQVSITYDWQTTIVCPRIDFDRPASFCGGN